ncbi:MAG: hypothetical protein GX594_17140, partial [Pirellulaceae bacterium]|nr:hypothetical protein [Pirellulaceae bacterium]
LDLLWSISEGDCAPADVARMEELVEQYSDARVIYSQYWAMRGLLYWERSKPFAAESALGLGSTATDRSAGRRDFPAATVEPPPPPAIEFSPFPSPGSPFASDSVGGWAFSYIVASVFVCLLLLGFWAYKLPSDRGSSIASSDNNRRSTTSGEESIHARPAPVFVGRVTGIAAAKWSDEPNYIAPIGVRVALGRTYKLKSGLMEITYDSGAKVILEGPCSYEVDSTAGGYLALGKLVARVESGERSVESDNSRRLTASGSNTAMAQTPEAVSLRLLSKSPNSQIHSPLSPLPSPLFTVRTPTAVVTDLGTEFGVEVEENGDTTSHVFQGSIQVRAAEGLAASAASGDGKPLTDVILQMNESVRVGRVLETHQEPAAGETMGGAGLVSGTLRFTHSITPPMFVRKIAAPPRVIDLLDIVAGGDGSGRRREKGIDSSSGLRQLYYSARETIGPRDYQPVVWSKFIDGVFVPNGSADQVQLDSAGHCFDAFPATCGLTWGSIWARAAQVPNSDAGDRDTWIYTIGSAEQFMPEGRGLLALHSNSGVTFDLEAIRRAHAGVAIRSFRTVAGMEDIRRFGGVTSPSLADPAADVWVFVDGRLEYKREKFRPTDGAAGIAVALPPDARFLTLATTDGAEDDGQRAFAGDWIVFGDPVLQISSTPLEEK